MHVCISYDRKQKLQLGPIRAPLLIHNFVITIAPFGCVFKTFKKFSSGGSCR